MSDTLHDRIRATVAESRTATTMFPDFPFSDGWLAHCDHADRILDRHRTCLCPVHRKTLDDWCETCAASFPCPEVRDLAEAWGVDQ